MQTAWPSASSSVSSLLATSRVCSFSTRPYLALIAPESEHPGPHARTHCRSRPPPLSLAVPSDALLLLSQPVPRVPPPRVRPPVPRVQDHLPRAAGPPGFG